MKFTIQKGNIILEVSEDEALLLTNALGGVCRGPYAIEDWEFQTLMGATKKEAIVLSEQLSQVLDAHKQSK